MSEYVLGSDPEEIARLDRQAAALAGASEALLRMSGIGPGMRVLDLGTGLGHVAFQVADMVGPEGSVVGVDREAASLAVAESRRTTDTVRFLAGEVRTVRFEEPFDAIVCRLLLMHLPDAVEVLRHHRDNLRPGGLMVVLDADNGSARAEPEVELVRQVNDWIEAAFRGAGADPRIGARLIPVLREAGYADVTAIGLQGYIAPGDPPGAALFTSVLRTLAPTIVANGIATEEEMGLDTLDERLRNEIEAARAVLLPPTIAGAWGRLRS